MVPGTYSSIVSQSAFAGGPITFIGHAGKNASSSAVTVTYNVSSIEGDFLLLLVQTDDVNMIATPVGWTSLYNAPDGFGGHKFAMFWKFKETDETVFIADPGDHVIASVLTFRNTDSSAPIDALGAVNIKQYIQVNTGQGMPSITTAFDGDFVLAIISHDHVTESATSSAWSNSSLSSTSELIDISTTLGWDGGFGVWGGLKSTAGATGVTTLTTVNDSGYAQMMHLALKPVI